MALSFLICLRRLVQVPYQDYHDEAWRLVGEVSFAESRQTWRVESASGAVHQAAGEVDILVASPVATSDVAEDCLGRNCLDHAAADTAYVAALDVASAKTLA